MPAARDTFPLLEEACQSGAVARLYVSTVRTVVPTYNVGGLIRGSGEKQAPLVVMTPRSGWWGFASEGVRGLQPVGHPRSAPG